MMKNLNLRTKLLLAFGWLALVSIFITGWTSYRSAKAALEEATFQRLTSIRETNKEQIESYFKDIRYHVITIASTPGVVKATAQLAEGFRSLDQKKSKDEGANRYRTGLRAFYQREFLPRLTRTTGKPPSVSQYLPVETARVLLQYHYIAANPYPADEKDKFIEAGDGSAYSRAHADIHPTLRSMLKTIGLYDIFLIDARTGDILYTVSKEVDLGTNLLTGPYKHTNLGRLFEEVRHVSRGRFARMADFEFYAPSYGKPAAFVAAPIIQGDQTIGVLAVQLSVDRIDDLMTGHRNWKAEGLGETGETYLVGADYLMRNDSRSLLENPTRHFELLAQAGVDARVLEQMKHQHTSILYQESRSDGVLDALNGNTGTKVVRDYRGITVLDSYTPLAIYDVHWALLAKIDAEEAFTPVSDLRNRVRFLALLVTIFSGVLGYIFAQSITKPIMLLVDGTVELGKGDLSKRVPVTSKDEIGLLTASFNQMAESLQQADSELREATAREMRIAREIQMGILPHDLSAFTQGTGLDIHAVLESAQEVGGDLFDVVRVGDDRVVVVIGDVSGKGIPAALFMAVTTTLLRTVARHRDRPEAILQRVNDDLSVLNPHSMFVTLLCAVVDLRTGTMTYASAGHLPPVLLRPGAPPAFVPMEAGTVAGIDQGIEIRSAAITLKPGDTVLLYTDGVTEAYDPQGELFGDERLLEHLTREPGHDAAGTAASVVKAVRGHAAGAAQSDDITMLAVRWTGAPSRLHRRSFPTTTVTLRSAIEAVEPAIEQVHAFCLEHGVPEEPRYDIRLALDEAFANVIRHGYGGKDGKIDTQISILDDRVRVEVRDSARPFNPLAMPEPDFSLAQDDRPVGGLGIHLIRRLMDRVEYTYTAGENRFIFERRFAREQTGAGERGGKGSGDMRAG